MHFNLPHKHEPIHPPKIPDDAAISSEPLHDAALPELPYNEKESPEQPSDAAMPFEPIAGPLPHEHKPHPLPEPPHNAAVPPEPPGTPPPHRAEHKSFRERKTTIAILILFIEALFVAPFMIINQKVPLTIAVFLITMVIIFIRPKGLNEAYIATAGAIIILSAGVVSFSNVMDIIQKIGGASITIISTIVMAGVLESFGFFHWAAAKLAALAKGSGYLLFWYIQLLCFIMTLLFNNDGSILITTPILIMLFRELRLPPAQQIPYLLSGALIATGSSVPIGVSNITNLIALNIIHMSLYRQAVMMFIPGILGLVFLSVLMFIILRKRLPRTLPTPEIELDEIFFKHHFHPLGGNLFLDSKKNRMTFMLKIFAFVFGIRCLLFVASYFGIPIESVALLGSFVLLVWRWYYLRTTPIEVLKQTPVHIFVFAFSMYVIIYGLNNIGFTEIMVGLAKPLVNQSLFSASFVMGGIISILSNVFNNHPALMIGTISLMKMDLDQLTLETIYLANIIGSDIGSLLLPIGTLASLMWMHILKKNNIAISWGDYIRVTKIVVPLTVLFSLLFLYFWIQKVFA